MGRKKKASRCELSRFGELDERMSRLASEGASQDELWQTLDGLPLVPSLQDGCDDRRCWWQHLYAILERHGLGIRPRAASV